MPAGPKDTAYQGGYFVVDIKLGQQTLWLNAHLEPVLALQSGCSSGALTGLSAHAEDQYPFVPPKMRFRTKVWCVLVFLQPFAPSLKHNRQDLSHHESEWPWSMSVCSFLLLAMHLQHAVYTALSPSIKHLHQHGLANQYVVLRTDSPACKLQSDLLMDHSIGHLAHSMR